MDINLTDFKNWLLLNGCADSTSALYCSELEKLFASIPQFDEANINQYLVTLKNKKLAEETLNIKIKAIKKYGEFTKTDIRLPKLFRPAQILPNYITIEFLENQIFKDLPELFIAKNVEKIKVLLYVMFFSGLRISEIVSLTKENFEFKEAQMKVYIPKTKEERLIPLTNKMMRTIIIYMRDFPSEKLIFNLNKKQVEYICKKIQDNYKIEFHPHTMRHSFAMHLKRMGFDILDIQFLLGHKNIKSTMRYAKADIKTIKEKFRRMK
jgi:site-specific recombinase XerD